MMRTSIPILLVLCAVHLPLLSSSAIAAGAAPTALTRGPAPELVVSGRRWVDGGPCQRSDAWCMNAVALRYVNALRAAAGGGRSAYGMGSGAMLENALAHTRAMEAAGRLYHQKLSETDLGCRSFFSGENVAQNNVPLSVSDTPPTDPARICVDQLARSPRHYQNMVSNFSTEAVTAVLVDDTHRIWCTQVFAKGTVFATGKCSPALPAEIPPRRSLPGVPAPTRTAAPVPSSTPPTTPYPSVWTTQTPDATPSSTATLQPAEPPAVGLSQSPAAEESTGALACGTGHVFRWMRFRGRLPSGEIEEFELNTAGGKCVYCSKQGTCLSEEYSVDVDTRLSS